MEKEKRRSFIGKRTDMGKDWQSTFIGKRNDNSGNKGT